MQLRAFIILLFLIAQKLVRCDTLTSPIYEYLKDLCPFGQLPLTGPKNVKTCASLCPLGAMCFKGICCVPPPQCRHPSFRTSAGYACLPTVKKNCPEGSQCVPSSQDGMYICCSSKSVASVLSLTRTMSRPSSSGNEKFGASSKPVSPSPGEPIPQVSTFRERPSSVLSAMSADMSICPVTHPIIAHDGKSLILCKDCHQGICSRFRTSSVEVCCQNSDDICGVGSQVLMDGFVPRDCSKKPCGKGFECSLTPSGVRVCCSLARCPSGVFARSVCAAGCLRSEKCVAIQDEMWCCPLLPEAKAREMQCAGSSKSTGDRCDPLFPLCPNGSECEMNFERTQHVCCRRERRSKVLESKGTKMQNRKIPKIITTTTTTEQPEMEKILSCLDGSEALFHNGLSVMCPRLGDPCPSAGFVCQKSDIHDVFVCCSSMSNSIPENPFFPTKSISTTTVMPQPEIEPEKDISPSCPFSYKPQINEKNGEVQRCLTLFSLDCPFGYTCLPSSTTDSYLCCIRKPLIR